MAKSKEVASLIEKKRLISKEIDNLQNMCEHKNKVIKSTKEYEASSNTVIRRMCEDCDKIVGMPTQQEIFEYLDGTR
jgi:predicted transcriptional regulator